MTADGPTIAVTGASGFIASWVVKELLERGATVHATVRTRTGGPKTDPLDRLARQYPDRLHLFEADLLERGSFASALRGCAVVIHMASPFITRGVRDPDRELVTPAVEGTRNVLESVNETRSVRRVVLTSSMVAAYGDAVDVAGTLSEADWNCTSSATYSPYAYSKTLAERTAWDIEAGQGRWQLVTVLPGFVVGPSLSSRVDGTSTDTVLRMLDGRMRSGVPDLRFGMVAVQDVARAHVEAALREGARGRYIVAAESRSLPDLAGLLRKRYPDRKQIPTRPLSAALLYCVGPFMGMSWRYLRGNLGIDVRFTNERSRHDLEMEYTSVEEALLAQAEQLLSSEKTRAVAEAP